MSKSFLTPVKLASLAADPSGVNGLFYYSTSQNSLRAYVNGAWTNVGSATSGAVLTAGGSTISVASGTTVPLTITNDGTGNSFVVNDVTGDTSPFIIDAAGNISAGGNIATLGDITTVGTGSTTSAPRLFGINTWAAGNAAQFTFGDNVNTVQSSAGGKTSINGYWGMQLRGMTQSLTTPSFDTGTSTDTAVTVIGTQAARDVLSARGAVSQSGLLQKWTSWNGTTETTLLSVTSAGYISTPSTELVLQQTGDTYGTTKLHLQNRDYMNGALFENVGLDLIDFGFKTSTGATAQLRVENRNGYKSTGVTEFQMWPTTTVGLVPFAVNSTTTQLAAISATANPFIVKAFSGQTSDLTLWRNSAATALSGINAAGQLFAGTTTSVVGAFTNALGAAAYTSATVAVFTYGGTSLVQVGQKVTVSGVSGGTYNGTWIVTDVSTTTFTVLGSGFTNVAGSGGSFKLSAVGSFVAGTAAITPLVVQGAASQTANLTEWQNSSGTSLVTVDASGNITAQSFVKASGTSSQYLMADGSVSTSSAGGIKYTYNSVPPSIKSAGDIWVDTSDGTEYTYVTDLNSSQWVELSNAGLNGPTGKQGLTGSAGPTGSSGTTTVASPILNTGTTSNAALSLDLTKVPLLQSNNVFTGTITATPATPTATSPVSYLGYMGVPQVTWSGGAYTLGFSDLGKHIYITDGSYVQIPSEAVTNLPVGFVFTVVTGPAGGSVAAFAGISLLFQGTLGDKTLSAYAIATLLKVASNVWMISGYGIS
jgi:hypothetical protein